MGKISKLLAIALSSIKLTEKVYELIEILFKYLQRKNINDKDKHEKFKKKFFKVEIIKILQSLTEKSNIKLHPHSYFYRYEFKFPFFAEYEVI